MSAPDSGVTAVLLQIQQLAQQFAALDTREDGHHRQVSGVLDGLQTAVSDLRVTAAGQGKVLLSIKDLDRRLAELTVAVEPLLPPNPGPAYNPAPAVRWWDPDLSRTDRDKALGRLRNWVQVIYLGQYGHLSAKLGDCWEQHPLCLIELDWASELWRVLYKRASRNAGVLCSQAEYGTRILPALAAQLQVETAECRHSRSRATANGWAGTR